MLRVIIVYLFIILISILVGLNIRLNNTKSSLHRETNNQNISLTKEQQNVKECKDGICLPPEEYRK